MSNSTSRDGDISKLHPAIRDKVRAIRDQLQKEKIPFEVFEAFRTPERQANLWAQGRTKPGNKVTWVGPWKSIHQYGLAVDFVLFIDGQWKWDDSGDRSKWWDRMHELAKHHGMTPIFDSQGRLIEKPHVQLKGASGSELYQGKYPPGGDGIWAERLCDLIDNWSGSIAAPPKPPSVPQRPPLDEDLIRELEKAAGTEVSSASSVTETAMSAAQEDARFQKLHAFVKQWEGGFVHDPNDKGGATNMGITQATLAAWRKTECTVDDVRNLSREEADAILRANYYALCRCGEMPERLAMVVYNGAVLHGPKRSIEFLQRAFNDLGMTADGAPLEVDGIIGTKTITAAKQTDASVLADAYMNIQDAFFRAHADFEHFGAGWLNRLASLREFVATLPQGAGLRPKTVMKVADSKLDLDLDDLLGVAVSGVRSGDPKRALAAILAERLLDQDQDDTARSQRIKMLARAVLGERLGIPVVDPDGKKPLTPVNAALGEGIGRFLDGKKSVIGVVGLLLTVLLPNLGLTGTLVQFVSSNYSEILTVLATFTGWGFLGKIDKAIREAKI